MYSYDSRKRLGGATLTIIFGVLAVIIPFAGIYSAKELPLTELTDFNSMMLMLLSVLLLVFLLINTFTNFNNDRKFLFVVGMIFFLLGVISFIWNMLIYVTI